MRHLVLGLTCSNSALHRERVMYVDYEGSSYIGCLLVDDQTFCRQMINVFQAHYNSPILEIGSLDLLSFVDGTNFRLFTPRLQDLSQFLNVDYDPPPFTKDDLLGSKLFRYSVTCWREPPTMAARNS